MTTVGGINIRLTADSSDFNREMKVAETRAKSTGNVIRADFAKTEASATRVAKSIKGVGASLLALSAGAALGLGASVSIIADFGAAMSTVEAVTGASEAQMAALTAEARRLGATTKYSATEAAEGMIFLARAGYTANEALMATEGTLRLAQAGALELGRAADIASNVLGGFNLPVSQTSRVVDVLAKAANSANVTVDSLGEALKFAAPTASALGLSLEETVAIIGKLGDSGLQGGLGGRGFQSFATAFVGKKEEIEAIIGPFNVAEEGLTKLIKRLTQAGITTEQVIDIFRAENLDVFTILANAANDAAKGIDPLNKKLLEAKSYSAEASAIMGDNLKGAILSAGSAIQELILAFGALGVDTTLTAAFTGLASTFRLAAENADILGIAAVALSVRALLPLAFRAAPAAGAAILNLGRAMLSTSAIAAGAGKAFALAGGPLTVIIAAAAAAFVVLGRDAEKAKEKMAAAAEAANSMKVALEETQDLASGVNSPFKSIADQAGEAAGKVTDLTSAIGFLAEGMKNLRAEGQIADALKLSEEIGKTDAAIRDLDDARNKAISKAYNAPNLGGKEGLQKNIEEAARKFDESENGRLRTQLKQQRAVALQRLKIATNGLTIEDFIKQFTEGSPETPVDKKGTGEKAKALEIDLEALSALERAQALELAKITNNEELVRILEEGEEVIKRTEAYVAAGMDLAEARKKAEAEVTAIREAGLKAAEDTAAADAAAAAARQRYDEFVLNRDQAQKEEKDRRDEFKRIFTGAAEDAFRSGNVGEAIRSVFADRVSKGMHDALNDLADALYNLFSDIFKNSNIGGSSGGGIIGGIGSFLGSVVSGGLSNIFGPTGLSTGPASSALSLGKMTGKSNAAPISIVIQGDANEKTIAIMEQKLAQHRAALPSAIDSRVSESIKRGRY
jgi:TP901 family phage tail tape measure protein